MNPLSLCTAQSIRPFLPPPLTTTRGRGWACATVDVYAVGDLAFSGRSREHIVTVQLSGAAHLTRDADERPGEHDLRPGHVTVTPAGAARAWRRSGESIVLMAWIAPSALESQFERATGRTSATPRPREEVGADIPHIAELARCLWQELSANRIGARLYVESLVEQLGLDLIRDHCDIEDAHAAPVTISPHKLRLAKAYIQENLSDDLSVEGIARAVGMSAFHFAHAFRAATGVPPHRYVVHRRIERAKALLRNPALSLTDIAQRVGYSSASHFSVSFRKIARLTPSDFRKGI